MPSTTIYQDFETLLTMCENMIYTCEQKVCWPTLAARTAINLQLKRDLAYVKKLQAKYPRTTPQRT